MPNRSIYLVSSLMLAGLACHRGDPKPPVAPVTPEAARVTPEAAPEPARAKPLASKAAPVAAKDPDCTIVTIEGAPPSWQDGTACVERLSPKCQAGDAEACMGAATILVNGTGGATRDIAGALALASSACEQRNPAGCMIVAAMYDQGVGVNVDPAKVSMLIAKACELGDEGACRAKAARAPKSPAFIEGANLSVTSIAADGLELRELMCNVTSGMPMLGALVIAGTIAKQKRGLDKCAPAGQAFAVTWSFVGGKARDIAATGGTTVANTCVAKALSRTVATLDGRCGALILVGKTAGATATIEAVRMGTANAQ